MHIGTVGFDFHCFSEGRARLPPPSDFDRGRVSTFEQSNRDGRPYHHCMAVGSVVLRASQRSLLANLVRCVPSVKILVKGAVFATLVSVCAVGISQRSIALEWVSVVAAFLMIVRDPLNGMKEQALSNVPNARLSSDTPGQGVEILCETHIRPPWRHLPEVSPKTF